MVCVCVCLVMSCVEQTEVNVAVTSTTLYCINAILR